MGQSTSMESEADDVIVVGTRSSITTPLENGRVGQSRGNRTRAKASRVVRMNGRTRGRGALSTMSNTSANESDWSLCGDSEESRIKEIETRRLCATNGAAPPLWSKMFEFAGMNHVTRSWAQQR